jgi:secreted trypsin-like serine protease
MLDQPAKYTTVARLLAPDEGRLIYPGATFTVAGWGALKEKGKSFPFMTEVKVPIVSNEVCADDKHYGSINKEVYPTNLCAGFDEGGRDACAGDSGGPLFTKIDGVDVIIGVVSWGIGCGRPNRPGVYTNLLAYRDWIVGA